MHNDVVDRPRLGIHSIGCFSLIVPRLEDARQFYDAFGLDVVSTATELDLRTHDGWTWGRVVEGEKKRIRHITFHCNANDLAALCARISSRGTHFEDAPSWAHDSDGMWFRDPDGLLLELRAGPKTTPDVPVRVPFSMPQDGVRAACLRQHRLRVRPTRLSHIMLFSPDVLRAVSFYTGVLGLRLSDRSGEVVAFTHGAYGSDHHLIAFGKSHSAGLHHFSWDVPTPEEVGCGAMQMAEHGFTKGWGIGRHVLGSNYFYYVADPWGSFSEYSAYMDFIPATFEWQALDHQAEDSSYLWGPDVPAFMFENREGD